jgi:hypothetical protein
MKPQTSSQALAFVLALGVSCLDAGERTALDDYVAKADAAYSWALTDTRAGEGYTVFAVHMTSLR